MQRLLEVLNRAQIFKYGVAAILLVVPLYPKFPLFNIPGTYVAVRAEDFLIAALGIFWIVYLIRNGSRNFLENPLNRAIVLFLGVGLLSVIGAILLTKTVSFHLVVLHWARRVEYIIPFFIAVAAMKTRRGTNHVFFAETLFITSFFVFLYGVGQTYASFPVISTQNEEFSKGLALRYIPGARLYSTFAGHYDLAAFLVLAFPIALAFFFAARSWLYRLVIFFGVVSPSFWLLMKTESRISFGAYLIAVVVTLWLVQRKLFIIPFLVISTFLMATVGGLGERYLYTIDIYRQKIIDFNLLNRSPNIVWAQEDIRAPVRLENKAAEGKLLEPVIEDRSTSIRFNVEWPRAVRAFAKNPLLGTGYSSIGLATDNDYLRLLGEVGLVGFLAFVLVITRLFGELGRIFHKRLFKLDFETAFVAGFAGGLVGLLFNATFIDVFEASKVAIVFWTLAGIAVGIVWRRMKHE